MSGDTVFYSEQYSLVEADIYFYFIGKIEHNASEELQFCHTKLVESMTTTNTIEWIGEEMFFQIIDTKYISQKTIFVIDKFEGAIFEHITKTVALVLGPKCILHCLHNEAQIPNIPSPIYTLLMKNTVVCASGISKIEKVKLEKLVSYMGGRWSNDLTATTTYLVTNTVQSKKYELACENQKKIVKPSWIYEAWKQAQCDSNVDLITLELDHLVPIFNMLKFTSTGLSASRRSQIQRLIDANGGKYTGIFKPDDVDILLFDKEDVTSSKYKAAQLSRKECLKADWIVDSVEKGYALPIKPYCKSSSTKLTKSTPKKGQTTFSDESHFYANCTNLSEIPNNNTINETASSGTNSLIFKRPNSVKEPTYKIMLSKINVQMAKKAGPLLDGYNIYLSGFSYEEEEKLGKVLNAVSATRYKEYTDKVSHILIGAPAPAELTELKSRKDSVVMLKIQWLEQTLIKRQIALINEFQFFPFLREKNDIDGNNAVHSSPATKSAIQSINNSIRQQSVQQKATIRRKLVLDDKEPVGSDDIDLIDKYMAESNKKTKAEQPNYQSDTENQTFGTSTETENLSFLRSLTVCIWGFIADSTALIQSRCKYAGAIIVPNAHNHFANYLIVPNNVLTLDEISVKYKYAVNDLWLEESVELDQLLEIKYYHSPIIADENVKPLANMCIVFSTYTAYEKQYLEEVSLTLGAEVFESYTKSNKPLLIVPRPEGQKYDGSVKWGLPAVSHEWLLCCLQKHEKVPYEPFLIGAKKESSIMEPPKTVAGCSSLIYNNQNTSKIINNTDSNDTQQNQTPIQHRRLTELMGSVEKYSPITDSPKLTDEQIHERRMALVMEFSPASQQHVYKHSIAAAALKTPEEEKRRRFLGSPETPRELPYECSQEYIEKQMVDWCEARRMPPPKPKTPETPLDVYWKRFWKESLGDKYFSPPCKTSTQGIVQSEYVVKETAETQNVHVNRLSDFIRNRNALREQPNQQQFANECVNEMIPIGNSEELHDMKPETCEAVGWRDPDEFFQSERFKEANAHSEDVKRNFIISNVDENEKQEIKSQIEHLSGIISTEFNENCTHLLCSSPSRGEKTFSAIASGLWVLSIKYISDSFAAGYYLNEELYEWGNEKSIVGLVALQQNSIALAKAAYRWRKKLQDASHKAGRKIGAFSEFRVILHVRNKNTFRSIVECGGGKVLNVSEPYSKSSEALTATHCIVDQNSTIHATDKRALTNANVLCLNINFLQSYLVNDLVPDARQFILK